MDAAWVGVIVAAIAAVVAIWQAHEARRARRDAQKARDDAEEHEKRALAAAEASAGAATRSASAHERMAVLAEDAARDRQTWEPRQRRGERWEIVNLTGGAVRAMLAPAEGERFLTIDKQDADDDGFHLVGPGEGLPVTWPDRLSMPKFARTIAIWKDPRIGLREELLTLERVPPPQIF